MAKKKGLNNSRSNYRPWEQPSASPNASVTVVAPPPPLAYKTPPGVPVKPWRVSAATTPNSSPSVLTQELPPGCRTPDFQVHAVSPLRRSPSLDSIESKRSKPSQLTQQHLAFPKLISPGSASITSKHKYYYFEDGNIVLQAENTLFKLHRYHLHDSPILLERAREFSRGSSQPIFLHNVSSKDFESFAWFLYLPPYAERSAPLDVWLSVRHVSVEFDFHEIATFAMKEIDILAQDLPPVDRVALALELGVKTWLLPAFIEICEATGPLTVEQALKLKDVVLIACLGRARESVRDIRATLPVPCRKTSPPMVLEQIPSPVGRCVSPPFSSVLNPQPIHLPPSPNVATVAPLVSSRSASPYSRVPSIVRCRTPSARSPSTIHFPPHIQTPSMLPDLSLHDRIEETVKEAMELFL